MKWLVETDWSSIIDKDRVAKICIRLSSGALSPWRGTAICVFIFIIILTFFSETRKDNKQESFVYYWIRGLTDMVPQKGRKLWEKKKLLQGYFIICLTCSFSLPSIRSEFGQTLWFYVQHPRESSLYVRLIYDSLCWINRPWKRLFIFIFLLSCLDHHLLTFIFHCSFIFLIFYLSIYLFICRGVYWPPVQMHINVRGISFAFLYSKPLNIANKTQMQMQRRTRNILFICKTRYKRKSGPAYQLVICHIIVTMPNETCDMNTWNKNNQRNKKEGRRSQEQKVTSWNVISAQDDHRGYERGSCIVSYSPGPWYVNGTKPPSAVSSQWRISEHLLLER